MKTMKIILLSAIMLIVYGCSCLGQIPDQTLYVDSTCTVVLPDYRAAVIVTDNCGVGDLTQLPEPGTILDSGNQIVEVIITATDVFDNQSSISFMVVAVDTIPPVITINEDWFVYNLDVTKLNDGTPIKYIENSQEWVTTTEPAYCYYENDPYKYEMYGKLYNYHAINSGKLCPEGYRVPTKEDWQALVEHIDPSADFVKHEASTIAGGKLKDTLFWVGANVGATNETGFGALPGGCRAYAGQYSMLGAFGYYAGVPNNYSVALRYATASIFMRDQISDYVGVSVRCVKDKV